MPLPLQVFEPRYRALMQDLMAVPEPWSFGVIAIREGHEVGTESVRSLYDVGCLGVVRQLEQLADGRFAMLLIGQRRFSTRVLDDSRPYLQADVAFIDEQPGDPARDVALTVGSRFVDYCTALGAAEMAATLPEDATELSYLVAATMMIPLADRQALLEIPDTPQRLGSESRLLTRELALMRAGTMPVTQPRLPPHSQN